jgi:hypothetical protein
MYQTGKYAQLVDVWMEDTVYETNGWRLVGILIWYFDVDFPVAAFERCYLQTRQSSVLRSIFDANVLSLGPLKRT